MIRLALLVVIAMGCTANAGSRDVTFAGDGVTHAGALQVPDGAEGASALVLVSGSGAQDRDETIHGQKPFLRIARYLEQHGIATLRYDDRGVGGSTGDPDVTLAEEAADLIRAIRFLCTIPDIDPRRVGALGHSAGGLIIARAASEALPAFTVLLAAPALDGPRVLRDQIAQKLRLNHAPAARVEANDTLVRAFIEATLQGDEALNAEADRIAAEMGAAPEWTRGQVAFFASRMARSFLRYDPAAYQTLTTPVLALFGEVDWQVDASANRTALEDFGLPRLTTDTLPAHNHLFQRTAPGRPLSATGPSPSTETLERLAAWIETVPPHPSSPCEPKP